MARSATPTQGLARGTSRQFSATVKDCQKLPRIASRTRARTGAKTDPVRTCLASSADTRHCRYWTYSGYAYSGQADNDAGRGAPARSSSPETRGRGRSGGVSELTTHNFNTGTRGFAGPEDATTAVCILPGTELAFSEEFKRTPSGFFGWKAKTINSRTAIFRQINKDVPRVHHDALEFPDGTSVFPSELYEGQETAVLQLPAQPKTPAEAKAQTRVVYVG